MNTLATGISYVDLEFMGCSRAIASAILHGANGVGIIDPGPSTTLTTLRRALQSAGIAVRDVTALLLTHIHLDHAGAAGTLAAENPRLRIYVHERGAPHMINPEKLLASATRLYGTEMERLWGEVRAVPASAIVALGGGERLDVGGRTWEVAYTPGHASHHVSYFNADASIAFVGDTAGVKVLPHGPVVAPTPPPDLDLDLWRASVRRIEAWGPEWLFLTHFGPVSPRGPHLAALGEDLERTAHLVRDSFAHGADDRAQQAWFVDRMRRRLREQLTDSEVHTYEVAGRFDLSWLGMARYWRKQAS